MNIDSSSYEDGRKHSRCQTCQAVNLLPVLALALVLASGMLHSIWNLFLKRHSGDRIALSLAFLWASTVLYLPLVLGSLAWNPLPSLASFSFWPALTVLLSSIYFLCLAAAYSRGDMSQVYPLTRGSGAVCATLLGLFALGEHLALLSVAGIALIVAGGYIMLLPAFTWRSLISPFRAAGPSIGLALTTGLSTGLYTVVDKMMVGSLGAPLVPYLWLTFAGPAVVLTLALGRRRVAQAAATFRENWRLVMAVGVLSPLSYLLMLAAMRLSPVSILAPAREVTLVFGTFLGVKVLGEAYGSPRIAGAASIALGVIGLALAR